MTVCPSLILPALTSPSVWWPKSRVTRSSTPPVRSLPGPMPQPAIARQASSRQDSARTSPHDGAHREGAYEPRLAGDHAVMTGRELQVRAAVGGRYRGGRARVDGGAGDEDTVTGVVVADHPDRDAARLCPDAHDQRALATASLQEAVEPGDALPRSQSPVAEGPGRARGPGGPGPATRLVTP